MGFIAFVIFVAYILFTAAYVIFKKKFSKKPKAWKHSLIFLILFPTWDVLIAFIIFIPSALFWSGDTIHEKVKTDTIHYDVYDDRIGVVESNKNTLFYKNFKYVEMEITKDYSSLPPMGLYRFWLNKERNIKYKKISEIGAKYTIQENKPIDFVTIPIMFRKRVVINRQENKIIASGKTVVVYYLNFFGVPFFHWLRWYDDIWEVVISSNADFYEINTKAIN